MGKTNPTYRDRVNKLESQLEPFRRALRNQHRPAFDRLMGHGKDFADAAGHLNPHDEMSMVLLSICLAQEIELRELRDELANLDSDRESTSPDQ